MSGESSDRYLNSARPIAARPTMRSGPSGTSGSGRGLWRGSPVTGLPDQNPRVAVLRPGPALGLPIPPVRFVVRLFHRRADSGYGPVRVGSRCRAGRIPGAWPAVQVAGSDCYYAVRSMLRMSFISAIAEAEDRD